MMDQTILEANLILTMNKGKPAIEIRTQTTQTDNIKNIIRSAWENKPIIIMPKFNNRIAAMNSLIQKNVIKRVEEDYEFII